MDFEIFFRAAMAGEHGPFGFQTRFATQPSLPELLRAPTGAGKTATAVLGWWWRRKHAAASVREATPRRLVFCLPMRSLVEQTAGVVLRWRDALAAAGADADVDVHALLGGAVDQSWELQPERDVVLVGTQDQLLSRALNRGYAMSRYRWSVHFGLLNNDALWVMDEVQLMGVGLATSAQLQGFGLPTFGPRHTVWMSATLAEGALATVDHDTSRLQTIELGDEDRSHPYLSTRLVAEKRVQCLEGVFNKKPEAYAKALAPRVLQAHQDNGGRTLVVLNQVDRAVALTERLRREAPEIATFVVHSRFRPNERRRVEAEGLARPDAIVVATQAIEAGVDLTSRTLFTEVACWSSMVQRFGRCNRGGEVAGGADIVWIDLPDDDTLALPYTTSELQVARGLLNSLPGGNAAPANLPEAPGPHLPVGPILRRRDLVDLFDTSADLSGFDIDVSRFIRDPGGPEVQVAWRSWEGGGKGDAPTGNAERSLERDELCRVPLSRYHRLYGPKAGWLWDPLARTGRRRGAWVQARRVKPGDTVLLPLEAGGYQIDEDLTRSLGFTGNAKDRPTEVFSQGPAERPEADEGEPDSLVVQGWVSLQTHSLDVRHQAEGLARDLGGDVPWEAVITAAHWHDLGKVHPAWQEMITSKVEAPGEPMAKRPKAAPDPERIERPYFRHELASALAYLQHEGADDLVAFLIAAHHGKVRTSIRSRPAERPRHEVAVAIGWSGLDGRVALGVYDHEVLPSADLGAGLTTRAVNLELEPMALGAAGGSWIERVAALQDRFGPYRLALLEALVRVADWRASANPSQASSEVQDA